MYCKNCGGKFNDNDVFCRFCGAKRESVEVMNENNNDYQLNQNENNNNVNMNNNNGSDNSILGKIKDFFKDKKRLYIACGIVAAIILLITIIGSMNNNSANNYNNNNGNTYNNNNGSNNSNTNNGSKIKGEYSREVFSNNSFDYDNGYDKAVFTFNNDSTFEVKYDNGNTYVGTYEIYNGLYINTKCNEIKTDKTITNGEQLASDIDNIWTRMPENMADMVNTYLIWFELNDGSTIQPFVVKYNPQSNEGIIVNVMARTQGSLIKK